MSVPFAGKAFHIDDPLYLNIARQILSDPLRPFDGRINWQQVTEPAWRVSISPPGFSYWLASWMALGVHSELGLHLAGAIWVVLLGLSTYAWARRLGPWPVAASLIVVASPLVSAGTNLMLDVPMLALATSAMAVYLRAGDCNSSWRAFLAGLLAGMAANVKYAGLVVAVVMGCDALLSRRWRLLPAAATALLLLGIGQATVAFKDGQPQLVFARQWITECWPTDWRDMLHRTLSAVMYLGSAALWPGLLAGRSFWKKEIAIGAILITAIGASATVLDLRSRESSVTMEATVHACLFASSGWLALAWIGQRAVQSIRAKWCSLSMHQLWTGTVSDSWRYGIMLSIWTSGFWYLGTLNGPFVAPRALLPCVISFVLSILALSPEIGTTRRWYRNTTVLVTMGLGVLVGAGDYRWAEVYREWAPRLMERYRPDQSRLYFLGHWGWQHYAEQSGMAQYDPARTRLEPGDLLVVPQNVDCPLPLWWVLRDCREVGIESVADAGWLPRTRDPRSLVFLHGDTAGGRIPWGWTSTSHPMEVFRIYRFGD